MNNIIECLEDKTNRTKEECIIINDILKSHNIIGHKNKEKIKKDFIEKLNIDENEANKIYNISMEIMVKNFFNN